MVTVRITIVILKTILTPKFLSKYYAKVLQNKSYKQNLDSFCYQTAADSPSPRIPRMTRLHLHSRVFTGARRDGNSCVCVSFVPSDPSKQLSSHCDKRRASRY